jgi:Glycosyltransferase family 87
MSPPPESVAPTRTDPVAASASKIIGGPLGRYAAPARPAAGSAWQPAAAVLIGLSSLTVAFGVLQKGHCFTKGWDNPDQFWHACYSDLPVSAGIGHAMPYLPGAQSLDQPLISGLVMWLVGLAVPDGSALMRQQWYFALCAVLITVIVMSLVAVTAASVPRAPWRAAHVALSPVLVLAGLVSVDLLGVLLASVALWAWGRNKVPLAGVLLGLAISARSYPLVLLVAIGLLALRSGRVGAWRRLAGTAMATWFAVSLPWFVVNADALLSVYRSWWRGGANYGSLWMVSGLLGQPLPQSRLTALVIVGWLAALAVGAFFALSLNRRPTVAEVSLVMLVIVVITGKAVPVQAALWLLPLIALVGLTWRDHLIWAGFEATYFVVVWLYIAGLSKLDRGVPPGLYSLLTVLRVAAWLYVLGQVWQVARSRGPAVSSEPVDREPAGEDPADQELVDQRSVDAEQHDEVDPLAGPMAGAPDQVLVRIS